MLDTWLVRLSAKDSLRDLLIPLVRGYIRYAPIAAGKPSLWSRVVEPYFAWHSHRFVASTLFGRRMAGDTRDMIQQYIYYFGIWEPDLTLWIRRRLRRGDMFIDVGANIGYFSLLASRVVGRAGSVVAIEASPEIFAALESNLSRNHARNVRAINVAATDRAGVVPLYRGPDFNVGKATLVEEQGVGPECEVPAAPLCEILTAAEARNARLIKIDVEGAEWAVVSGLLPVLEATRPDLEIVVEIHAKHLRQQVKRPEDILSVMSAAGFHPYELPNEYWALAYLGPRRASSPIRLRSPIERDTTVVFSRREAEQL